MESQPIFKSLHRQILIDLCNGYLKKMNLGTLMLTMSSLAALCIDREGSLSFSWQIVKSKQDERDGHKNAILLKKCNLMRSFWRVDILVDIIKTLNWKCWRQLVINPKFNYIEYGGYLLEYSRTSGSTYLNPVIHLGETDALVYFARIGMPRCTIHTHPNTINFQGGLPSGEDFRTLANNGYQIIINRFGIVVYSANMTTQDSIIYEQIAMRSIIEMNDLTPYITVKFIGWNCIKRK